MVFVIISNSPVQEALAIVVADRYVVSSLFGHLHLQYLPQAGSKYFV